MSEERLLVARALSVGFSSRRGVEHPVRQGLEVGLRAGEMVCLLGPNGAGKSTLLRTLSGMLPPLAGEVELADRPLAELLPIERARRIAVVLPQRSELGLLSARELVALGRHPHTGWTGQLSSDDEKRVVQALEEAGIAGLADRDVGHLSDGERQKVMIARALAQEASVVVLDEPTAFLDLPGRVDVLALLKNLAHGEGGTRSRAVLLSTHDLDLALRAADRLWLLPPGGGLIEGVPEDLVLGGALRETFGSGFDFDPVSGSFHPPPRGEVEIGLRGDGPATLWTRRALERIGYRVIGESGPELMIEIEGGAEPRWWFDRGGERHEFPDIETLLASLEAAC